MYFTTYLRDETAQSGILLPGETKVLPLTELGKQIGEDLPSTLLEFVELERPELIEKIREKHHDLDDSTALDVEDLLILAPIPNPRRNILGVAKNFEAHIGEVPTKRGADVSKPMWFSKSVDAVTGPDSVVHSYPDLTDEADYEAEMAVLIGKTGKNISIEEAEDYVFGYLCANDIGARDEQVARGQFYYAKSFDTFCPLGPVVLTKSSLPYPPQLDITFVKNGQTLQQGNTRDLIHGVSELISDWSQGHTLHAGDIILTGTPSGVGHAKNPPEHLRAGDEMAVTVEHLGTLRNFVD